MEKIIYYIRHILVICSILYGFYDQPIYGTVKYRLHTVQNCYILCDLELQSLYPEYQINYCSLRANTDLFVYSGRSELTCSLYGVKKIWPQKTFILKDQVRICTLKNLYRTPMKEILRKFKLNENGIMSKNIHRRHELLKLKTKLRL